MFPFFQKTVKHILILESVSNKVNLICRRFVTSIFETIFESLEYMLNKIFKLEERNTNFKTEIIAGISTFFTLSFIIAVNPAILSDAGIDFAAGFVATIIASALGCFMIGIWAGWPVAIAPGMGLNAYFAYVVVLGYGFSWQQALAAVFTSSVLFFLFSLSRARSWLILSIPKPLQAGITAGIGMFLAMIGLTSAGIIIENPDTLIGIGDFTELPVLLSFLGLIVMAGLSYRGLMGAILLSIITISVIGWSIGIAEIEGVISKPPLASATFSLDFSQIVSFSFLSVVFAMFFVDFFDTTGTLTAIAEPAKLRKTDGTIVNLDKAVLSDTSASIFGSLLGTSNMTTYLESAAGLKAGGRTGLTSITVGILFLSCLFFEPLFASIPSFATAPALIFVAATFLSSLRNVNWDDVSETLPVLVIILVMPLTFSIAAGIAFGFFAFVGMKSLAGEFRELTPGVWVISTFGLIWLILSVT